MVPSAAQVRRLPVRHRRPDLDRLLPPGGALSGRLFSRLLGDGENDAPLPPDTRVGDWRIGRLLGRGGSSTVYLAHRADGHFEQQVALKIVRQNRRLIEQFRRERQILAELRHPAIARLIDGGQLEGGRLWFAMEPVFGERIDHYVRNRRLPLDERLALFEEVCAAVAYAHSRLLIHRDIKPGNLLVDETGWPCLLDFGIASAHGALEGEGDDAYRAMTPIYASPEQRTGGVVTTASDIFQLGALLRALVAPEGSPCITLPRRPRRIIVTELNAVIARATAADASHRYRTVSAFMADIAAIRQRRPVSVIGGIFHPIGRFLERHSVSSAIACVGIAALLSTGWIAAWRIGVERDHARAAVDRARAADAYRVSSVRAFDSPGHRSEPLTAPELLSRGAARLDGSSGADPARAAEAALKIASVYADIGEFRRARDLVDATLETLELGSLAHSPEHVRLLTLRGRLMAASGDEVTAVRDIARARADLASIDDPLQRDVDEGALAVLEAHLSGRPEKPHRNIAGPSDPARPQSSSRERMPN